MSAQRSAMDKRLDGWQSVLRTRELLCALALLYVLLAASCASIQQDVRFENLAIQESELPAIELRLAVLRLEPNPIELAELRGKLNDIALAHTSDVRFMSRLRALQADAASLAGERNQALRRSEEALQLYRGDEYALIVDARLTANPEQALAKLERAIETADSVDMAKAERGLILEKLGRFREAVSAIDEVLPLLEAEKAALYIPARDRALAFKDLDSRPAEKTAQALAKNPALMLDALVLIRYETSLLDWYLGEERITDERLFTRLNDAGWFGEPKPRSDSPLNRRMAALFIWQLMCRGNKEALGRYSTRWATRTRSPLPDVPLQVFWFDAALGTVEADIIPLEEGTHFAPDKAVSGSQFWDWLRRTGN